MIGRLEKRVKKDDAWAMTNLAWAYLQGGKGLRKDEAKALELLNSAAGFGSADAIRILGEWTLLGQSGLIPDRTKAKAYFESAAMKGDVPSRFNLAALLAKEDNIDLAIKHWHLSAAAGCENSMKRLWECFFNGRLSKPDLEKALRAHKAASDEMNSEERERHAASREALAGNDALLNDIYVSYYLGFINAKELKVALKNHRAGNLGAVEALLNKKVPANYR